MFPMKALHVSLSPAHLASSTRPPIPLRARPHCRPLRSFPRQSSPLVVLAAAGRRDPYEVLDVPRTADIKAVKRAFRKKALKLHPDVNKAADARERFMECKSAYQEILERSEGSRRGSGSGFDAWAAAQRAGSSRGGQRSSSAPGSAGGRGRQSQEEEEFYGLGDAVAEGVARAWQTLGDLFNDLEKEWSEYSRSKYKGAAGPKSLWEELADIGEEFVEFLEKEIGLSGSEETSDKEDPWSDGSWVNDKGAKSEARGSNSSERRPPPPRSPPPPPPQKSRKEVIDDELEALKRKMGLK